MGSEDTEARQQPIEVKVLTGPPGCKKTTRMREEALQAPGLYIFSMPSIALIEEQAKEFQDSQPSLPVFPVHKDVKPKRKINRQIEEAMAAIKEGGHTHAVVMMTHVSMMAEDLTAFRGWHARIDEAPNSVQSGKVAVKGAEPLFESLFILEDFGHAKWRVLKPIGPRPSFHETKNNPALAPIEELIRLSYRPTGVLVDVTSFRGLRDKMSYWSIWTPADLEMFASTKIAGASYESSLGAKVLKKWFANEVQLVPEPLTMERSGQPLIKVHYFTQGHRPSTWLWDQSEGRRRLKAVADWLEKNAPQIEFWSGNPEVLKLLDWRVAGEPIKPRVAGLNRLRHAKACALIYSSGRTDEDAPLQAVFDLTDDDIRIAREDEDVLQFVMRGGIRNPEYDKAYDIYLYAKEQAERLAAKLVASEVGKVELVPIVEAGIMDLPPLPGEGKGRGRKEPEMVKLADGRVLQRKSVKRSEKRADDAKKAGREPRKKGRPRKT